ncbi:MAG TPA: DUF502 domain-containing protein [Bacillota bacterium]|nr:DUF502 domain-containing protein [Bacillota bacterium]HOA15120.1 DUF502 domain-containing protein [Bacillota bacterium]HOG53074.1 DUF502 domain-containing protein [Bacillota bacterium]
MSRTKSVFIKIKDYLLAGLLILAPIVITIYVLIWSFNLLDGILGPFIYRMLGRRLPGVGLVAGLLITLLAGFITRGWLARRIMKWAERMVTKLPLIRPLYMTIKQLTDAMLSGSDKNLFKKVVLLEYPRQGIWSVGFVTSEDVGEIGEEIRRKTGKKLASVFVVSAPNPTTGWLALVPEEEMTVLDISVEQALKLVVSGGYIRPEEK